MSPEQYLFMMIETLKIQEQRKEQSESMVSKLENKEMPKHKTLTEDYKLAIAMYNQITNGRIL